MKHPIVIALDIGSSSVRATLYDSEARPVPTAKTRAPYSLLTLSDGGSEIDAEDLLGLCIDCIARLVRIVPHDLIAHCVAVGVSCFWHSLVGVGADGRAVTSVMMWADTRASQEAAALREQIDQEAYRQRTGCFLHPSYWPAKLLWMSRNARVDADKVAHWMSFAEYLTYRVFGETSGALSMASGSGLLRRDGSTWDDEILSRLPVRADQLLAPQEQALNNPSSIREFADVLGIAGEVIWINAIGDGACANVGCGASNAQTVALTVGTSAAARVVVRSAVDSIPDGLFCYRVDQQLSVLGGAVSCAGNAYAWLAQTLNKTAMRAAPNRAKPDSHGLTVMPFWAGERSPGWRDDARASIIGMGLHTTGADIVQAVMESVAYSLASIVDQLVDNGFGCDRIVVAGGAVADNAKWVQMIADVVGRPVCHSTFAEASSRGAAIIALVKVGVLDSIDSIPLLSQRMFNPVDEHNEIYACAKKKWRECYERLRNAGF
jgi:gluconokinase